MTLSFRRLATLLLILADRFTDIGATRRRVLSMLEPVIFRHSRAKYLFDDAYYNAANADVQSSGQLAAAHYLAYGGQEDRNPNPVFHSAFYRARFMGQSRINPLLHFYLIGSLQRQSPSPYFSYDIYVHSNTDVATGPLEPFEHFSRYGILENRTSCDEFNATAYAAENPDVQGFPWGALGHFLMYGEGEGRGGFHHDVVYPQAHVEVPSVPDWERWIGELTPPRESAAAAIDVIVPVYRGAEETLACIYHVLSSRNRAAIELIIVADAPPDTALVDAIRRLALGGYITLIENAENLGFVASVNRGMQLHQDRDVILLNSDTEVYGDWADRLQAAAESSPSISTVTPLTNNGTICSYPNFLQDNHQPLEITWRQLDELASKVNPTVPVPCPTAVGFCMYIKRAVIAKIGYFDVEAFGRGYGEENDFCLRAQRLGYLDTIATNVFVRHLGGTSFGAERNTRMMEAQRVIDARYPRYSTLVRQYVASDPLRNARASLDLARIKARKGSKNILIVSHSRAGGTEQFVQSEIERLEASGYSVFRMRADYTKRRCVVVFHRAVGQVPNFHPLDLVSDKAAIEDLLIELEIDEVHIHHLVDFGMIGARQLLAILGKAAVPYSVFVHDYLAICPRISLMDETGTYCGEPGPTGCRTCLAVRRSEFGAPDIVQWRNAHYELLAGAQHIVTPDADVANRMSSYWPDLRFEIEPLDHPTEVATYRFPGPKGSWDRRVRVGTIGAISPLKGLNVLMACSAAARQENQPLTFAVVGFTSNDKKSAESGLTILGPYSNSNVHKIIADAGLEVLFLASTAPETYSFTLSIALEAGLPIVAFDLGAIAARLRRTRNIEYTLLPLGLSAAEINEALVLARANSVQSPMRRRASIL